MEDKLTSSSDMLFANVLNNILSDNGNLVKNLIFHFVYLTPHWWSSLLNFVNAVPLEKN